MGVPPPNITADELAKYAGSMSQKAVRMVSIIMGIHCNLSFRMARLFCSYMMFMIIAFCTAAKLLNDRNLY